MIKTYVNALPSYIWNAAQNSSTYNQLTFGMYLMICDKDNVVLIRLISCSGVFLQELSRNFQLFKSGRETYKLRFFVGHDGTMVRLASALGFGKISPLRWPALGSEINMEVSTTIPPVLAAHHAIRIDIGLVFVGLGIQRPEFHPCSSRRHSHLDLRMDASG